MITIVKIEKWEDHKVGDNGLHIEFTLDGRPWRDGSVPAGLAGDQTALVQYLESKADEYRAMMPPAPELSLPEVKQQKYAAIERERERRIALGIPHVFPDGSGLIQTRSEIDFRNIQGLSSRALKLKMDGITAVCIPFRDVADNVHMMTPAQAVAMGEAVTDRVQAIYQASWLHKNAAKSLQAVPEVQAYDFSGGWPA